MINTISTICLLCFVALAIPEFALWTRIALSWELCLP